MIATFLDFVASHVVQRGRCNRFARAQIESCVMPWTPHGAIDHQAFGQWSAVMCARRADGKKLIAASRDKNRFAKRLPQKHVSIGHVCGLTALLKIRSFKHARSFSHKNSLLRTIRIAPG